MPTINLETENASEWLLKRMNARHNFSNTAVINIALIKYKYIHFNQSVRFHVINRNSATHKPKREDRERMMGKRMRANEWVLTLKISKSTAPYAVPCYL